MINLMIIKALNLLQVMSPVSVLASTTVTMPNTTKNLSSTNRGKRIYETHLRQKKAVR